LIQRGAINRSKQGESGIQTLQLKKMLDEDSSYDSEDESEVSDCEINRD